MQRILSRDGYSVVTARHGGEAIRYLADRQFDAILLDMMMPIASGFDVVEYLRQHGVSSGRVIVITAAHTRQLTRLDPGSVFAILQKPFDLDELCATLARCTRREGTGGVQRHHP